MRRLKLTFMVVIMSISTFGFADNHAGGSESAVLKALSAYMDARNTRDFKTVIAMSSKAGTLDTNSDGSFHKPLTKQTIDGWEKSGDAITQYYYPEATAITDDVVHVRFYSEGMVGNDGKMSDYRTRVTMNWIKEGGNWVLSSAHYSPASYGGVHKTQASDFED
jgi:ketosteroid isomerase-like protein